MGTAASLQPDPLTITDTVTPTITFLSNIKQLPDAIDEAIYTKEKWPLVLDLDGNASRFLKYQRGSYLLGFNPADMEKNHLRKLLVGAIEHGSNFTIKFNAIESTEQLTSHFNPTFFPNSILNKMEILDEKEWTPLLRPDEGDKQPHEYQSNDGFCLILLTESNDFPPEMQEFFQVIQLGGTNPNPNSAATKPAAGEEDSLEAMFGAAEVIKNSKDLVEACFDGEMEELQTYIDKGYHVDSIDGRGHTALSEAASQGHDNIITHLLALGANPNLCNDTGRSPMYQAAFNGHVNTISLLLESGADREAMDKSNGERPFDVAKDDATRAVVSEWDYEKTTALMKQREKQIIQKMEERIVTAADRENLARMLITKELVQFAEDGNLDMIKDQINEIVQEAESTKKRPLVTCEARNPKGQTLLSIAVQYNQLHVVEYLLDNHKTCDEDDFSLDPGQHSWEYRCTKANVNSRDNKGWTVSNIATFHENPKLLRLLLDNGANPLTKNAYGKNCLDSAKDDLDAANCVVKDRSEIRSVLVEWDNQQGSNIFGTGKAGLKTGDELKKIESKLVAPDGTAVELQLEMEKDDVAKNKDKGKVVKKKGGVKKLKGAVKKLTIVNKTKKK